MRIRYLWNLKMKVGLIRVDGKFPNLALMKLSSWHKKRGDDVVLIDFSDMDLDRIYASNVFIGGPGYDLKAKLPDEIEHCKPDYDLFATDFSIGFTSRGCIRNCKFCIVRAKEGHIREHADLEEFVDDRYEKVILMDNSFLASPKWKEKLQKIIDKKWKVSENKPHYIIITDEYLGTPKYRNRAHRILQIARNHGIKTKVVDVETDTGITVKGYGGLICFTKKR